MHTDLNLLKVFVVVATAENFRVAADRLGVSRSAVSQAIRVWKTNWAVRWCSAPPAACA